MARRAKKQRAKKQPKKDSPSRGRRPQPPTSGEPSAPSVPAWRLVTREQLGVLMGVHPDTVTDNVRHGMPILRRGGAGKEGAYDAVACLDWQRSQIGKNAKDNAQTRVANLSADLKALELELQQGRLVPREQVVREVQAFGKGLSAMIRALPRRAVQAGVIEPEQEGALADVCTDVLREISQWQTEKDLPKGPKAA
jgi:hypothetical protein